MYFDATEFAARLSTLRKAQGMTQEEMAEALNISLEHFSKMERGKRKPSIDLIIAMACYFHVSTDYLLGVEKKEMLDVSGLTASQITAVLGIIAEYRKANNSAV